MTPKHLPCEKVKQIDRLLNGNGEKGVLQKVDEHETIIQQLVGAMKLLKLITGTSLIGLALSTIGLIISLNK